MASKNSLFTNKNFANADIIDETVTFMPTVNPPQEEITRLSSSMDTLLASMKSQSDIVNKQTELLTKQSESIATLLKQQTVLKDDLTDAKHTLSETKHELLDTKKTLKETRREIEEQSLHHEIELKRLKNHDYSFDPRDDGSLQNTPVIAKQKSALGATDKTNHTQDNVTKSVTFDDKTVQSSTCEVFLQQPSNQSEVKTQQSVIIDPTKETPITQISQHPRDSKQSTKPTGDGGTNPPQPQPPTQSNQPVDFMSFFYDRMMESNSRLVGLVTR